MRFLLIFLLSFLYAQTDHLGSQIFSETYDQILHIGNGDSFDSGLHIVERSDANKTTVDSSALAIGDSLVGARTGMHLLQGGVEITASAADLNLLQDLSSHSILYDSSNVFVNAPRTIYGWSHDLTFSASDFNTIAWTSGSLYFTNLDTFSIVSGNTGNISAITWIYFNENASSTVLQTTTNGGSAIGNSKIIICVGEDVTSGKDAVFQVFGNSGQSSLIGTTQIEDNSITTGLILANTILAGDIAANTITGNEILANSLTVNEVNFSTVPADSLLTQINGGGGVLFITADVINAVSSSGSGQRIVISPADNRLYFYDASGEILRIGEDVNGNLDGIKITDGTLYVEVSTGVGNVAVRGVVSPPSGAGGIGGSFSSTTSANAYGVFATAANGSVSYGVRGAANGTNINYGVYGNAFGSGTSNYGIYGRAVAATTNWAGYFEGNVNVTGILDAPTLNTGQGDNELYDMDQNVQTSNSPAFVDLELTGEALTIEEIASAPAHSAGHGKLWVKNDAPTRLYFTDDSGKDDLIPQVGVRTATGHGTAWEGKFEINTFDNAFYVFADGAWRTLASW